MAYFYSAGKNAFYVESLKSRYADSWPADAVEVSDEVFFTYSVQPPEGKLRSAGSDGLPTWVDKPAMTAGELITLATATQVSLIAEAKDTISIWQSELLLGTISDDDKASLTAWISYIKELQTLDFSSITDEASYDMFVWPQPPEA